MMSILGGGRGESGHLGGAPKGGTSKGGAPNQKGWAPQGGAPQVWPRRVGPQRVGPQRVGRGGGGEGRGKISRFLFPSPATIFFLSSLYWMSFRGILVFEAPEP